MINDNAGTDVYQQLDQLDTVLTDLRAAIMITDSESLLEHSRTLQTVVNQLERHYDSLNDRNTQLNEKVLSRLQKLRRKLVGVGTLLQLSRAKAADLLELMLGAGQEPDTYAENGQLSLSGTGARSLRA
ncbi:MAG: hypothetical protein DRQ60_06230 [Gammaproteobacteria bacterium]|nr:MAG: hypothetical protein DRQ60_06230 [Gammaproteobacteria bacterium]